MNLTNKNVGFKENSIDLLKVKHKIVEKDEHTSHFILKKPALKSPEDAYWWHVIPTHTP